MGVWSRLQTSHLLGRIGRVYSHRLKTYGPTHRAVLWNDPDEQRLRFEVLLQVIDPEAKPPVSVADFGCGYGVLFDLLADEPFFRGGSYVGYDLSARMVAAASARIGDERATFEKSAVATREVDYTFASGTFNLKLDMEDGPWAAFLRDSLRQLWRFSRRGLAFNMLDAGTGRSDPLLYYGRSDEWLAFCRDDLGARVELVEDYPLGEWSLLLRRPA